MTVLALVIVFVVSAVLFVLGFIAPRRSRKAERKVNEALFSGERESGKAPGRLPPKALRKSLDESRKLADKSAEAGRAASRRITPNGSRSRGRG